MRYRGLLRAHTSTVSLVARCTDLLVVFLTSLVAHQIYLDHLILSADYWVLIGLVLLLTLLVFPQFDLYKSWRGQSSFMEVGTITTSWLFVMLLLTVYLFINKAGLRYSRGWVMIWMSSGWLGLILSRIMLRAALSWVRAKGYNTRHIIIVGDGDFTETVVQRLQSAPWLGLRVLGQFQDAEFSAPEAGVQLPQLGALKDVPEYLSKHPVDQVWITLPLRAENKVQEIIHSLRFSTVDIRYVPNIFAFRLLNHSISEVEGLPVLNLSVSPMNSVNRMVKLLEDKSVAFAILMLIWPLLLLIAALIRFDSRGPVLFKQKRLGWDGKTINVYKFRTMVVHKEIRGQLSQAKANDARVTPIGQWLRRTSLDELPQFINVLQGRMSVVGPRPHALEHNEKFKQQVQDYMWRHKVKPGITGWAQVNGWRGETDTLEKLSQRVDFDLYYIENWSLWFDLKIILLTILKGFIGKSAY